MEQACPQLAIETKLRRPIPNECRPERAPPALAASVELFRSLHPDARLRSITATYNCIGLVVACRRTWVDTEELIEILQDDGFRRLPGAASVNVGDLVIYHDEEGEVCHVGVINSKDVAAVGVQGDFLWVLSKWGADGEYLHRLTDVPALLGRPTQYWTDRKEI